MPTGLAMTGSGAHRPIIRFGVFELDQRTGELRKHGLRIKLKGQPIDVLAMLLEHHGEVVTREELQKKLWPADTFVDFEHSLNAAIKRLRAALNDSADHPRYVETLARRGYRLIAPVNGAAVGGKRPLLDTTATVPTSASFRSRRLWLIVTLALCAAGLVGLSWRQWRNRAAAPP